MSCAKAAFAGCRCWLFRVSFTGELGFEVNVPSDYGRCLGAPSTPRAQRFGVVAYGTEAMHVLRAEKGYIIVGQETDGTVTPDDAGLEWAIGKAKTDFVGKRRGCGPILSAAGRQFVGLLTTKAHGRWKRARRSSPTPASRSHEGDGPCHLELLEHDLRPPDRAGACRGGRAMPGRRLDATRPAGFTDVDRRARVLRRQGGARAWLRVTTRIARPAAAGLQAPPIWAAGTTSDVLAIRRLLPRARFALAPRSRALPAARGCGLPARRGRQSPCPYPAKCRRSGSVPMNGCCAGPRGGRLHCRRYGGDASRPPLSLSTSAIVAWRLPCRAAAAATVLTVVPP